MNRKIQDTLILCISTDLKLYLSKDGKDKITLMSMPKLCQKTICGNSYSDRSAKQKFLAHF